MLRACDAHVCARMRTQKRDIFTAVASFGVVSQAFFAKTPLTELWCVQLLGESRYIRKNIKNLN